MATFSPVPDDYGALDSLHKELQKEFEELKQAIYTANQQLNLKKALLREHQHEIGALQSSIRKPSEFQEEKVLSAEETLNNLRTVHTQKITTLESELMQKEESINQLKSEIDVMKRKKVVELDEVSSPGCNLDHLLAENEVLKQRYACLQEDLQLLHDQHAEVQGALQENQKLLNELTSAVELKDVELEEKELLIGTLSEKLCAANEQLKILNSKPLPENSRGNSLFAQVHDRKIQLQEAVDKMKFFYTVLEKELKNNKTTLLDLHRENCELRKVWGIDLQQQQDTFKVVMELSTEMKPLEDIIDKLKVELTEKLGINKANSKEDRFYQHIINEKTAEICKLYETLTRHSKKVCDLAVDLTNAKREMRLLNFNALELQHLIEESKQ